MILSRNMSDSSCNIFPSALSLDSIVWENSRASSAFWYWVLSWSISATVLKMKIKCQLVFKNNKNRLNKWLFITERSSLTNPSHSSFLVMRLSCSWRSWASNSPRSSLVRLLIAPSWSCSERMSVSLSLRRSKASVSWCCCCWNACKRKAQCWKMDYKIKKATNN